MGKIKKILVVGGTGFIGYHVISEALKKKWKVTSISLNKPKKIRFHLKVNYKFARIEDFNSLKKNIKSNYDYVVNAGGYGKNVGFDKEGEKLLHSHYQGTLNLVKIFSKKKIKKFVQIGSSAEYGDSQSPQLETAKCNPRTPYAIAKYLSTILLIKYFKIRKFPSIILRFFLVYGPRQDENRILPSIIKSCLKNKSFPTTKGDQYCDFCHVDDVVNAIFKSLLLNKIKGEVFNIGSGKPIQIINLIKLVKKFIGRGKPLIGKLKYNEGINKKLFPDIKKAKNKLKWRPLVKFDDGLRHTIRYYEKNNDDS